MILFIVFIFGLIIGSFLNACIWRLNVGRSVLHGRSVCTFCDHVLAWHDLIPLLSFLHLKGLCRYCQKPISLQYPLVELATGILFAFVYFVHIPSVLGSSTFFVIPHLMRDPEFFFVLRDWFFVSILIVIFVYDFYWKQILDLVTLPAIVLSFFINGLLGVDWKSMLLAGVIGGGFFLLQYLLSKGTWIGDGDIRLGFLMGVMVGFPAILLALFMTYCVGALVAVSMMLFGKAGPKSAIPFGPFLSGATIVVLLYGEPMLQFLKPYYAL